MRSTEEMARQLRASVGESRYQHALRSAKVARELAERHGVNPDDAYLAGLLHDCAKYMDDERMLAEARAAGIAVDPAQALAPVALLHSQMGALIARREYGVENPAVLRAIGLHNAGGTDLTPLDCIAKLADLIEPARAQAGAEEIRRLAWEDLYAAQLKSIQWMIRSIVENGGLLHPDTAAMYNDLVIKLREAIQ